MSDPISRRHDLLITEYGRVREDSRVFWVATAALLSVAVAFAGGTLALSFSTCTKVGVPDCAYLSPWVWSLVPVGNMVIGALLIQQVAAATLRSDYEKALEKALFHVDQVFVEPPSTSPLFDGLKPVPVPSYSHLINSLFDFRIASWQLRGVIFGLWVAATAVYLGTIGVAYAEIGPDLLPRLALLVHLAAGALIAMAGSRSIQSRDLWRHSVGLALKSMDAGGDEPTPAG